MNWINGRILADEAPVLPADDSAYLYGYGVFETLVAHEGRVLLLKRHFQRMRRNARRLGLKFPISLPRLEKETYRLLVRSRLREAYLRFNLSESADQRPRFAIIVRPFLPYPPSLYRRGGRLVLVRSVINDRLPLAGIKSTNYLTKKLGRREAARKGAVEGVLLNARGRVTEGASSNIFIVKRGRVYTPPLSDGLMPGTRRRIILRIAKKRGVRFREKTLRVRDLEKADELFITSTLKGILPIRTFEGKRIGEKCPGPVTTRLMTAFESSFGCGCRSSHTP